MTKINKEEYEILKNLDEKWKWIAKDDNYGGFIFCFREKPHKDIRKGGWSPDTTQYKCLWEYDVLFQFIQWEDEEPHNISELIEEYENKEFYDYVGWKYAESEETEVNKDIQWLKEEIEEELEGWYGVEGGINEDGINVIKLLIDQHEESEVKRLEKKIKELDSYNDELVRDNNQFRNELDNQEVLSEEWINKNKKYNNVHDIGYYIPVDKLYGKIVPKQEVTIDKEDAENIVQYKEMGWTLSHLINDYGEDASHDELLAKAWLAYPNIEVEEEKKYIVSDNSSIPLLIKDDSGEIMSYDSQIAYNNSNGTIELTEQEIKGYDKRYMAFAKPVEELEE